MTSGDCCLPSDGCEALTQLQPTLAKFRNIYNVRDGVIIVNRLSSVEDALREEMEGEHSMHITDHDLKELLPRFHAWADLAYDGWNRVRYRDLKEYYAPAEAHAIESHGPKMPRYLILQDAMLSRRSTPILKACIRQHPLPRYPGASFGIGSACFNAMLSTEENGIFAELLASQKRVWGRQALAVVRVFQGDGDEGPTFVWGVRYYDEQLRNAEVLAWAQVTNYFRGRAGY